MLRDETEGGSAKGYRGPRVCAIVGITYRQLDYWARTKLVVPSITEATGSGSARRYSYEDVLELKVIKKLLDAGIALQTARKAVTCLRDTLGEDLAASSLVIGPNGSVLAKSGDELIDLLREGQGVLSLVSIGGVLRELDESILELGPGIEPAPVASNPQRRKVHAVG